MKTGMDSILESQGAPKSLHMEIAILGAMQLDAVAIADATAKLRPEDFSLDSHQRIYRAMVQMHAAGEHIDSITLGQWLEQRSEMKAIGGPAYLAYLCEGIPRNFNIEAYVRVVKDKSLLRWGMGICHDAMVRFADSAGDPLLMFSETVAALNKASADAVQEKSLEEQNEEEFEQMAKEHSGERKPFIPSGVASYDDSHGGYALGEMTVLGARPNVGKSPLVRQSLLANCEAGNFTHLFTPEMRAGQVLRCLWALVAQMPFHKVRYPERMTRKELEYLKLAKQAVSGLPLKIDDSSPITAAELLQRARRVKLQHDTKLLAVDYLQKLAYRGRPQDRHIDVTDAMVALTAFAKQERVALLVVSSITEPGTKEKNRPPTMDDLRQSGDIKYEAHTVLLLHRERDPETLKHVPETRLIVAKARAGEDGTRRLYFDGAMQRFSGYEEYMRRFEQ